MNIHNTAGIVLGPTRQGEAMMMPSNDRNRLSNDQCNAFAEYFLDMACEYPPAHREHQRFRDTYVAAIRDHDEQPFHAIDDALRNRVLTRVNRNDWSVLIDHLDACADLFQQHENESTTIANTLAYSQCVRWCRDQIAVLRKRHQPT